MTVARSAYDSLTERDRSGSGHSRIPPRIPSEGIGNATPQPKQKTPLGRSGVDWVWRPGVGPPGDQTLEHSAYRCLTRGLREACDGTGASQFRHLRAQLQTQRLATLSAHGEAMGDTWRADSGVASWTRLSGHLPPRRRLASWSW